MQRSFKSRLAALEALEAVAEAERSDLPDVALMDDTNIVWEAILGLRARHLVIRLTAPLSPIRIERFPPFGWLQADHAAYWDAVAARATPLFDAATKPVIITAPWEVADAIAAIDAGKVLVTSHESYRGGSPIRRQYHLWPVWPKVGDVYDTDLLLTLKAVGSARTWELQQRYYPQDIAFPEHEEMTTLEEWRAWLEGIDASEY